MRERVAGAAAVAVVSLVAVFWLSPTIQRSFFVWGHNFSAAVSYACGRGFGDITIPQLADFLNRRQMDFDCGQIPADTQPGPLNAYADGIPYVLRGLGLYWRWRGVSWTNLLPLVALMFAASNVFVFLLGCVLIGTRWAFAVALAWLFSPGNYYALLYYEHYAKVPIFLACVLLMVWLAWSDVVSPRRLFAAALAGGVLLGVGFGIRADLWLLTVPFVAVLLWICGVAQRPHWRTRAAAAALFVTICIAAAVPAVLTPGRSYFWLQLVEGLASDFDAPMSIRPATYEWIPRYRDELGAVWMRTHAYYQLEHRTDGAFAIADWRQQEAGGRAAYFAMMRSFPADFLTRPLAAARAVIVESFRAQPAFALAFASGGPNLLTRTAAIWSEAAAYAEWLVPAVAIWIIALARRRPRQAVFLGALVLYVAGSTALYFEQRHRWHLYFIAFIAAGACVRIAALGLARAMSMECDVIDGPLLTRGVIAPIVAAAAIAAALVALRSYQDRHVRSLADDLLRADTQPTKAEAFGERFKTIAAQRDTFEYTDYVRATFDRAACESSSARIVYEASRPELDFSRTVTLDFHGDSRWFAFVFPAYASKLGDAFGYFKDIAIAGPASACVPELARIGNLAARAFLITWRLPERWLDLPRHQVIALGATGPR